MHFYCERYASKIEPNLPSQTKVVPSLADIYQAGISIAAVFDSDFWLFVRVSDKQKLLGSARKRAIEAINKYFNPILHHVAVVKRKKKSTWVGCVFYYLDLECTNHGDEVKELSQLLAATLSFNPLKRPKPDDIIEAFEESNFFVSQYDDLFFI